MEDQTTQSPNLMDHSSKSALQKVNSLTEIVQDLKKDHAALSSDVKGAMEDGFLGPDCNEHEALKRKYIEESSERRRLYNEVIELKGNIRVFCRCRPLNEDEVSNGSGSVVEFDAAQETDLQIVCSDSSRKQFKFDHVFGPQDNQGKVSLPEKIGNGGLVHENWEVVELSLCRKAVFAETAPVVLSVLDGFNVCIFAYGQTGTGKTFTMEGTPENRGVNYRTLEELFRISNERGGTSKYELFVSMLEVYNEKIRDLLVENSNEPSKKLEIKQAAEGTQEIPGLTEARVHSTDEVWDLLKTGSRIRAVGSTNANELSSRSHCLLRVTVRGESLVNGNKTRSHLWLVDLAGSERVSKTEVEGERLKESQFINKSLSALGDVISALASKTSHIPYRNSKLTHLLQSSLGGDCKTLMFVQISPSAADLGETLCSLNFASRVRGIEQGPARKQADHSELYKYKQMVEKLRHDEKESKKLQDSFQSLQLRLAVREQFCKSLLDKVRDLENQLAEERKVRLQSESRAAASASASGSLKSMALPTIGEVQKGQSKRKPPLGPSRLRPPLRGISNLLPPPSPLPSFKTGLRLPTSASSMNKENTFGSKSENGLTRMDKENNSETVSKTNVRGLMRPRRFSIAVRPPKVTEQIHQPKRRVSVAAFRSDSHSSIMMTPLTSKVQYSRGALMPRRSLSSTSRMFPAFSSAATAASEATPVTIKSKFLGSPVQSSSFKLRTPSGLALPRRHFVWSPLKQKALNNTRKSLPPPTRYA
ncbi:hypothetical protein Syun_007558 [Stephania yunnanensis]|uniref:Kinesin-like protein n=1 Tax=Stephania yunnanensis TaxID=152371 RepID=A0AAP0KYM5_9MAGN